MVRLPSDNYGAPHCVRSSWCQDTHPWDFDPSGGNLDIPFPDGYPETTAYSGASHFGYPLAVTHGPGFRLWEGVGSVANDCIRNMSTGGFVRPWCDPFIQAGFDSGTVLDVKGAKVTGVDFQIFDVPDPRPSCGITNVGSPYNFDFVHHPRPQNINLRVDEQHSRLSMVSMLAPSPDWFTGLESVELCVNGVWASQVISTQPFDSGVDCTRVHTSMWGTCMRGTHTHNRALGSDPHIKHSLGAGSAALTLSVWLSCVLCD